MAQSTTAPSKESRLFPLLLVNFIGTMGYSLILPFLVILVTKFKGNEMIYGIMGATYSFFQLIGAPVLGSWSDRIGRRKILLVSQAGTFLAWIIFLVALLLPVSDLTTVGGTVITVPLALLFLARALDGITGGNVSVANAYLADVSTDENRQRNFGRMGASANLGFIIGPLLAGVLGATALEEIPPVIGAMLISLIAIMVIAVRLPESNPCVMNKPQIASPARKILGQEHRDCQEYTGKKDHTFRRIIKLPNISYLLVVYFLIFLAFNFLYVAMPMFALQELKWGSVELGVFFAVFGGMTILVQGPLLSWLSKRYSSSTLIIAGMVFLTLGFPLMIPGSPALTYLTALLLSMGNGIMWPTFLAFLAEAGPNQYQGSIQGYASSAGSLASIIGLISGGVIYTNLYRWTFLIPSIVFFMMIFVCIKLISIEKSMKSKKATS